MAKQKEFKVKTGKQPIYSVVKVFMKLLFKKPLIINLAGELEKNAIIVGNHSAKSGPPSYDLYYPVKCYKWGAHEMFESYKNRKAYLRDILYIQKMGKKPGFATSFKAGFMAIFNKWIYNGMKMIPTYPDVRLVKTLKQSMEVLDAGLSVMIYPENSNSGYFDVLTEFFPGFYLLADKYFVKTGKDLPVYPVYYSIKKRILVIGKPLYVQELKKQGLDKNAICETYKNAVNELYYNYVENAQPYKGKKIKNK